MATDKNISIGHDGGLIEWSATSDPTPPTITITGTTWATVNGSNVTVQPNTNSSQRSTTITVQASTTANTDYNGTASVTSAYTLTQEAPAATGYRCEIVIMDGQFSSIGGGMYVNGGEGDLAYFKLGSNTVPVFYRWGSGGGGTLEAAYDQDAHGQFLEAATLDAFKTVTFQRSFASAGFHTNAETTLHVQPFDMMSDSLKFFDSGNVDTTTTIDISQLLLGKEGETVQLNVWLDVQLF